MNKAKNSEAGAALLIVILLLAAIMSSSLILSTVVLKRFQTSSDLDNSLTAFYAAETGLEKGLYEMYKGAQEVPEERTELGEAEWLVAIAEPSKIERGPLNSGEISQITIYDPWSDSVLDELMRNDGIINLTWEIPDRDDGYLEWALYAWQDDQEVSYLTRGADIQKGLLAGRPGSCSVTCSTPIVISKNYKYVLRIKFFCQDDPSGPVVPCVLPSHEVTVTAGSSGPIPLPSSRKITATGWSASEGYKRALMTEIEGAEIAFPVFDYGLYTEGPIRIE